MSLRLRLVVAFFLLSVVPLAAVTFYSYVSNERALQVAAQHETELLTGELTQRMQVVTRQISDRVEHLMDMPVSNARAAGTSGSAKPTPARTVAARRAQPAAAPATPVSPAPPAADPVVAVDAKAIEKQVAGALGEVAMLLNNVEVRGLGRMGGRTGGPRPAVTQGAPGLSTATTEPIANTAARVGMLPMPMLPPQAGGRQGDGREGGDGRRGRRPGPDGQRGEGARPEALQRGAAFMTESTADHMKLDLAPIRRELFREMAPNGEFEKMTPEERQRVGREVNQRLMGIVQGMKLGAAELQKKADAAKQQAGAAAADAKAAARVAPVAALPAAPSVAIPTPPAPPPAAPAAPPAPAASRRAEPAPGAPRARAAAAAAPPDAPAPPAPMTRKAALTGTSLDVRLERNGEVVQQVNAEINLPNLLATVFANTRRDSGEIPFAVGKDGHVYAPTESDRSRVATLDVASVNAEPRTRRMDDWIVVTMPDQSGAGLRFGIARPVGELLKDLRRTTARNAGFGLLFIGLALVGIVPLSGRLTRNLSTLTEGVGRIAQGDYAARVPVKSRDEIGRLAAAFNSMAADVEQHQRSAIEQERIRRELELGRRIQSDMLPRTPLHFGLTEVKGVSVPAREVGGDFFNYFRLDSGLVALLVGDVSGKGVGAALLMANIQASLRTRFALGQGLSAIAEAIDVDIEENSPGPVYATLFVAIFDPLSRRMRYVNAGHNPQFVLRTDGRLEKMAATGLPVGLLAGHGYEEMEVQLAPGDLLFFYTDGCVEMENESGDMFGSDRLEALVAASARGSADEVLAIVEREIAAFRGGRDLFDDATMMAATVG